MRLALEVPGRTRGASPRAAPAGPGWGVPAGTAGGGERGCGGGRRSRLTEGAWLGLRGRGSLRGRGGPSAQLPEP